MVDDGWDHNGKMINLYSRSRSKGNTMYEEPETKSKRVSRKGTAQVYKEND